MSPPSPLHYAEHWALCGRCDRADRTRYLTHPRCRVCDPVLADLIRREQERAAVEEAARQAQRRAEEAAA